MTLPHHPLPRCARHVHALLLAAVLAACGGGDDQAGNSGRGGTDPATSSSPASGDALEQALTTGDARGVTRDDLLASTQALLGTQAAAWAGIRQALFGGVDRITWNPSPDSWSFTVLDRARIHVTLPSNWRYAGNDAGRQAALAVVGSAAAAGSRFAAFGSNPIAVPGNEAMDSMVANTVAWLSPRAGESPFKVVAAHLPGDELRRWFGSHFADATVNGFAADDSAQADDRCDGAALDACLQGADLLVIGSEPGPRAYDGAVVMRAVAAAQGRGIPVLYLHHGAEASDLDTRLLAYFGLRSVNNYWEVEGLQDWDPATPREGYAELLTRLEEGRFSTDWSGCTGDGRVDCDTDAAYAAEFGTQAEGLRSALRELDAAGTTIFGKDGFELEKRLVLLGDKFREPVSYPLDKERNKQDFFRALFSDAAAYLHRPAQGIARNLGNFSGRFAAGTATVSRRLEVPLPASGSKEYLTGLYVMPGRSVTLTRSDTSAAAVRFGLNMLRDTTWAFSPVDANGKGGLDRPTQITSPGMPLAAGASVTISSPYGGPLLLFIDAAAGGEQAVAVKVDGVITHPVLRDPTDAAQVAAFKAEVAATPTHWVAMTSDTLTLHSTLDHFRETMATYGNDMARLGALTWTYTIQDTYELAGFNAASGRFRLSDEASAFCRARGWDCTGLQHRRDQMQHVISDAHAYCGSGCSGNPYDQDWAFDPMGWGESHEIGHNLQRSRLMIYGDQSGEVSNNIYPVHKLMRYNTQVRPAQPIVEGSGAAKAVFGTMMAALAGRNPSAAMHSAVWGDTSYAADNDARVTFYRQLAEYARHYNAGLGDGWSLYTLMHLLDRNIDANAGRWSTVAAAYGMGTYAEAPSGMDGNDFMLVSSSFIIGRDMRPVFELWGITVSGAASAQVAAYGFPAAQKLLFPMSDHVRPSESVGRPVVITSGAVYPDGF